jgi:hypothetical protein
MNNANTLPAAVYDERKTRLERRIKAAQAAHSDARLRMIAAVAECENAYATLCAEASVLERWKEENERGK